MDEEDRKHREWLIASITEIRSDQKYTREDIGEIKDSMCTVKTRVSDLEVQQGAIRERQKIWNGAFSVVGTAIGTSLFGLWVWIKGGN